MAKLKQTKNRKRLEEFLAKNPEVAKTLTKNGVNTKSGSTESKGDR